MITVFLKILIIFLMAALGYFANKLGILPSESNKYLVNLMLLITTPCMIISSLAARDISAETFSLTIETLVGSLAFFVIIPIISLAIAKIFKLGPHEDIGVLMVIMTALNTGFMGFPITKAIFGDFYFFLMVIQNIVLNIYIYFIAIIQLNYGQSNRGHVKTVIRSALNPCVIAALTGLVFLFGKIKMPDILMEFFTTVGDATIPVSMIVVGIQLADSDLKMMIKNRSLLIASIVNIVVVPIITFLMVNWLPIQTPVKVILIFAAAFPCAVAVVGVAAKEDRNSSLMAEGVALTTAISMITLPITASLLMAFYNL